MIDKKKYGWGSLRLKLILASTLVEFIMLGVLVWNSTRIAGEALVLGIEHRVEMLAPLLNASLAPAVAQRDYATLEELLERIVRNETLVYVEVRDAVNRIVSVRGTPPAQETDDLTPRLGDAIFDQSAGITVAGQVIGQVRYGLNVSLLETTVTALRQQGLAIAGVEMALTFLLLAGLGFVLTRNLGLLAGAARRIDAGDFSVRVPVHGRDELADVAHAFNTMTDNIARQLKSLRENQSLLEAIVNNSAAVIAVKDVDGKMLLANREYERVFGVTQAEILEKTEREILPSEIALRRRANDERVIRHKTVVQFEETIEEADGPHAYLSVCFPLLDESRIVRATASISTDITQRKRVEESLRALATGVSLHVGEDFYASLVKCLAHLLHADYAFLGVLTDDGRSIKTLAYFVQGELAENIEYDLTNTPCALVVGQKMRSYSSHVSRRFPNDTKLAEMNAEWYVGAPLFNSAGSPLGIIAVVGTQSLMEASFEESLLKVFSVRAATELERRMVEDEIRLLNEQLEQRVRDRTLALETANAELESFSYSVSHDLRSPLRAINGFSHALVEDYAPLFDAAGREHLKRIGAASERMGLLIDDLLDLARVARQVLNRERVNLGTLAGEALAALHDTAPQRRASWTIEPNLWVVGDMRLLRVVLENLLENAWKYSSRRDDTQITVGSIEKDGALVIFVRDNGVGFDMQYAHKLFGAFQRLHATDEFPGTGIGLATVARIIRRHGGAIWAEAELNQGATFFFTVPDDRGSI